MKILRVISSMNPDSGGPCQGIRNAIPELNTMGIYNEVVCLDHPMENFLKQDTFIINALGPSKTSWCYNKELLKWLLFNLNRFDVVIVHGLWQYHGYAVRKAINKLKIKGQKTPRYYVMPHGMLDPYFQVAEGRKLKAIRNVLYWKFIESKLINASNGVLFTCQAELLLARNTFKPYHPKKELNAGYGIETPPDLKEGMKSLLLNKCPKLIGQPYLLFLSRIHPKKGVDILINVYKNILETMNPNLVPMLVIAGPGIETEYGQAMNKIVNSNEVLNSKIIFPGMLSGDIKWGAFYGSEAFILPSHQENFGIAVAEALACGKPVLISNQVNIFKEIELSEAGFVSEDNYNGVSDLITNWIEQSTTEKEKMASNAFQTFKKYFTIHSAANSFLKAIS